MAEDANPVMRATIETAQRVDISEIPLSARFRPLESASDYGMRNPRPAWYRSVRSSCGTHTHPSDSLWLELFAIDHDKALLCCQARRWPRDTETSNGLPVLGWDDFHDDFIPRLKRILGPAYFGLG